MGGWVFLDEIKNDHCVCCCCWQYYNVMLSNFYFVLSCIYRICMKSGGGGGQALYLGVVCLLNFVEYSETFTHPPKPPELEMFGL